MGFRFEGFRVEGRLQLKSRAMERVTARANCESGIREFLEQGKPQTLNRVCRIKVRFFRRTPHPVIVTIKDNKDYIRVLLYSYYTTITGWGVLLRDSLQGGEVYGIKGRFENSSPSKESVC